MEEIERNLGRQPISKIMLEHSLKSHDLVLASDENITHKMVNKACKGRRLNPKIQSKILRALNKTLDKNYSLSQLFNY